MCALIFYLFPKGMSVMMISTELDLIGKLHKSQRTVSIGSPGALQTEAQMIVKHFQDQVSNFQAVENNLVN